MWPEEVAKQLTKLLTSNIVLGDIIVGIRYSRW